MSERAEILLDFYADGQVRLAVSARQLRAEGPRCTLIDHGRTVWHVTVGDL